MRRFPLEIYFRSTGDAVIIGRVIHQFARNSHFHQPCSTAQSCSSFMSKSGIQLKSDINPWFAMNYSILYLRGTEMCLDDDEFQVPGELFHKVLDSIKEYNELNSWRMELAGVSNIDESWESAVRKRMNDNLRSVFA